MTFLVKDIDAGQAPLPARGPFLIPLRTSDKPMATSLINLFRET